MQKRFDDFATKNGLKETSKQPDWSENSRHDDKYRTAAERRPSG
jgi:hypothetical protein